MSNAKLRWIHARANSVHESNPVARFPDLVKQFGTPDILVRGKNGRAVWTKKNSRIFPFSEVWLLDEQVAHNNPAPHNDFLYTTYPLRVDNKHKIRSILALSESVVYDSLKQEIRARCHFMGANVATIYLALQIARDKISGKEARRMYGPTIFSTIPGHPKFQPGAYKKMYRELTRAANAWQ